jgi:CHAP domain
MAWGKAMATIGASVGRGGANRRADVTTVQTLINNHIGQLTPLRGLETDGVVGLKTIGAILEFQRRVVGLRAPDGRVDPNGRTLRALNGSGGGAARTAPRVHYPVGPQEPLAAIARPYIGATEARGNRMGSDPRMREIFESDWLASRGSTDGYAWCCSFVSMCVQKLIAENRCYRHVQPPKTASVSNFRTRWAVDQNCLIFPPNAPGCRPHKGDVVVFRFSHIGIVDTVGAGRVHTIEGNTNEAGSREGTAVLEKERLNAIIRCFIRLPVAIS